MAPYIVWKLIGVFFKVITEEWRRGTFKYQIFNPSEFYKCEELNDISSRGSFLKNEPQNMPRKYPDVYHLGATEE